MNARPLDTIRMELLRWLDRNVAFREMGTEERRGLMGSASRVVEFLCDDVLWLVEADDDFEPELAVLRQTLSSRLGLAEDVEEEDGGEPIGLQGFATELVRIVFEPATDADAAALGSLASLLSDLCRTVDRGASPTNRRRVAAALTRYVGLGAE